MPKFPGARQRTPKQRRTIIRKVRLEPGEDEMLIQLAAARGLPPATYLREAALRAAPPARRSAGSDHAVRSLARVGALLRTLEKQLADSEAHATSLVFAREARQLANDLIRSL